MFSTDHRRRIQFWQPNTPAVSGMVRIEREDRARVTYTEHFTILVVYEGAFDGWYRGQERTHVAGALKLKEPGEVHRDLRVHAPFTLQGASVATELMAAAADAAGLRGTAHFRAAGFGPKERAAQLAFAMHEALVRESATEIECATLVAETLNEIVGPSTPHTKRAQRAVHRARDFLHDALAAKVTLDELSEHAGLDKFHLVRAFRDAVGVPPYEYLTHLRVARARRLLQQGLLVAEAAQNVGFCDESQLHRHFRRIVGVPPGVYARSFCVAAATRQLRPSVASAGGASSSHERTRSQQRPRTRPRHTPPR